MKSKAVPAMVGALATLLIVVVVELPPGVRIPNGSIGLRKPPL